MTDPVKVAIIVSTGPTLVGLAGLLLSWFNGRAIKEVHKSTNSRLDQLVQVTKTEAFAAGVKQETDKEKG
jgi:hypothetical protein